jgi:hypothetical protein
MRRNQGPTLVEIERNPIYIRLIKVIQFRYQHNQLKQIILKTMSKTAAVGKSDSQENFEERALSDINEAYNHFLAINVLDISKEG